MAFNIVYRVGTGLYINLTNACTNRCAFCVREFADAVGEADSLWLDREPTADEVLEAFYTMHTPSCTEAVFCGFGEPTCRLEVLLAVARGLRARYPDLKIRVNTNGHANLIAGFDVTPELAGLIDCLSISLNAANAAEYAAVCHPDFGTAAYDGLLDFAVRAVRFVPDVVLTIVEGETDEAACRAVLTPLGLRLRIRKRIEG